MRVIRCFYNLYLSSDKSFVAQLRRVLGFVPANINNYRLAFTYRTADSGNAQINSNNNERLEFLGDAVLGTIVAEYLYRKYLTRDEGFLTKMRSKIVNRKMLNEVAEQMSLDTFLVDLNKGTINLSGSALGNALEAFIGAVYLDIGYSGTREFVIKHILRGYLDMRELEDVDDNYKSQLLEWCQRHRKVVSYETLSRYKVDNRDRFKVAVLIDNEKVTTAEDFTKKNAEQIASEKALRILGQIT